MKRLIIVTCLGLIFINTSNSQEPVAAANAFIHILDSAQRIQALYPFDSDERYNFHFFITIQPGVTSDTSV